MIPSLIKILFEVALSRVTKYFRRVYMICAALWLIGSTGPYFRQRFTIVSEVKGVWEYRKRQAVRLRDAF